MKKLFCVLLSFLLLSFSCFGLDPYSLSQINELEIIINELEQDLTNQYELILSLEKTIENQEKLAIDSEKLLETQKTKLDKANHELLRQEKLLESSKGDIVLGFFIGFIVGGFSVYIYNSLTNVK